MTTRGHILFAITCTALMLLMLVPHLQGFRVMDDAYMYVRYADHLLQRGEYAWNAGEGNTYGTTSVWYTLQMVPFRLLSPGSASGALVASSFLWGMVFVALALWMVRRSVPVPDDRKGWRLSFAMALLTTSMPVLSWHFGSGMETTLVLCWGAGLLLMLQVSFQSGAPWHRAVLGGAFAGLAYFLRPDLLVFALGIPAVLFLFKAHRRNALRWGLAATGLTLVQMGLAWTWLGSALPLPFFLKTTGYYGPELAQRYEGISAIYLAKFISLHWPAALVVGMGLVLNIRRIRRRYGPGEWAIWAACLVFSAYYLFMVIPIMGYWQRFYYPLLPFVLWLGTRDWMRLLGELEHNTQYTLAKLPRSIQGMLAAAVLVFAGFYGWQGMVQVTKLKPARTLLRFDDMALYRQDKKDYWWQLDAVASLPDDFRIATTEVGMVAALNPGKHIVDLAGLNDPQLATGELTAVQRLTPSPPDLIYLPHPDYVQLRRQLLSADLMQRQFTVLEEEALTARTGVKMQMGIAILKGGRYEKELMQLLAQQEASLSR